MLTGTKLTLFKKKDGFTGQREQGGCVSRPPPLLPTNVRCKFFPIATNNFEKNLRASSLCPGSWLI